MKHRKQSRLRLGWLVFFAFSYNPAMAALNEDIPAQLLQEYDTAVAGDSDATERVFAAFQQLYQQKPASPLVLAALGSTGTMMARDSFLPWRQLKYLETGMGQIDKSLSLLSPADSQRYVQGLPVTVWVKNTAGCTFVAVPEMFNRLDSGYRLLQDVLSSPEVQQLPFEKLAAAYLCAGSAAQKLKDPVSARKYLQPLSERLPATPEGLQAAELLKSLAGA